VGKGFMGRGPLMAAMLPVDDAAGGNNGGGGGAGNGGQQGDQGGQQQGGAGSLLESTADDLGAEGAQGGGGQQQQQQQGGGTGQVDVNSIVSQVTTALESRFDSIADRRVNAILREIRGGGGQQQGGQQQQGGGSGDGGGGQQQQQQAQQQPTLDVRGARLSYREYIGDQITFISAEERAHAADLGAAMIAQRATEGATDDERVGREVAAAVAKQVKGLREHYETRVVAALKKRGALVEGKEGQTPRGPAGVGAQSEYDKGVAIAQSLRPTATT
jgi:hypothetical protein